jgi:hypothetical protein
LLHNAYDTPDDSDRPSPALPHLKPDYRPLVASFRNLTIAFSCLLGVNEVNDEFGRPS